MSNNIPQHSDDSFDFTNIFLKQFNGNSAFPTFAPKC